MKKAEYENMRIEVVNVGPMPKYKFDNFCRATLHAVRRATMKVEKVPGEPPVTVFRDPEIQAEFEAWLAERKKKEEEQP